MADKPILFSAPMVRALLAGTKTQTRRLLKSIDGHRVITEFGHSDTAGYDWHFRDIGMRWCDVRHDNLIGRLRLKHGDRLWVREAFVPLMAGEMCRIEEATYSMTVDGAHQHRAGQYSPGLDEYADGAFDRFKWSPSIHMPRWASRITLTVTDVRVQRLHDISEDDAKAEGMTDATAEAIMSLEELSLYAATHILCPDARGRVLYEHVWDHINGPGSWAANPWVAAYTFTVALGNIDSQPLASREPLRETTAK